VVAEANLENAVKIRQPRVRHRDGGSFSSEILPKYMRRVPSVDALIPALYLKGISTGDFSEALSAISRVILRRKPRG